MFIPNYNPQQHDLYLYNETNVGFPTGFNPNHELYPCRESLASISVRYRQWYATQINPDYPSGPPEETPVSQYPNYYNNGQPSCWFISSNLIAGSVHYVGHFPSDTQPPLSKTRAKKTNSQNNTTFYFWSDTSFSGLSGYGPFYSIYNCVTSNEVRTTNINAYYFSGSPEIPGYETGNTYYQVLQDDFGAMEQVTPKNTKINPIKAISLIAIAKKNNIEFTDMSPLYNLIRFTLTDNFYFIDGQDRCISVPVYIELSTNNYDDYRCYIIFGENYSLYDGDSSGHLLYKDGNTLYSVGHLFTYSIGNGILYGICATHSSKIYPVNEYFLNRSLLTARYVYSYSSDTESISSTDINNLNSSLNTLISDINDKISELS